MNSSKQIELFSKVTLIAIAILPLLYLNRFEGVPLKAFILGTGSWGIGLILKMIAHQLVVVQLDKRNATLPLLSLTNGFLSGLFELGASVGVILLMRHKFVFNFKAIISFGLAIGSFESIIVALNSGDNLLKGTALEKTTEEIKRRLETSRGIRQFVYEFLFPVGERILSTFIHISTRGLIFVSLFSSTYYPIGIAFIAFIIADGFLGYYFNASGKLLTDKGFVQVYFALFILTVFVSIAFFVLITPFKNISL